MSRTSTSMRARALGRGVMLLLALSGLRAQTESPSLLVVFRGEKSGPVLGIVDVASGKLLARIPTGKDPHVVAASPDGRWAYVANTNGHNQTIQDGDSLSVIDVVARKEVRRVEIGHGGRPNDVQVVGDKVFFTAAGFKSIGRYDTTRQKVEFFGLGQNGPHKLVVSKDAKTIFAANNNSDTVSIIDGEGPPDWKATLIPVGKIPEGIDMSADGKEVWVVNEGSSSVSIIDVATRKVTATLDVQTHHANRLKFTPDGKRVILLDREVGEVVVVDAATRKVAKRIKLPGDKPDHVLGLGDIAVLSDGSRAYVTVNGRDTGTRHYIAEIDLKTLEVARRIETATNGDSIAWAAPK